MKCAVAIVLALIGVVVASPVAPHTGLSWAAPPLLPSAAAVGYGKVITPIIEKVAVPIVKTVPILKSVPIIRTPVLTPPLSIGYPGYGYGLGYGGLGYGGLGYGGLGYGYGGLGWGKGALGYDGLGYGKEWH